MAATLSGSYNTSPDMPSPVFPDRLIRPLPKRPIRSRLSPEAAGSILYPPTPPATQLFYTGAYHNHSDVADGKTFLQLDPVRETQSDHSPDDGFESGEDEGPVFVRRHGGTNRLSFSFPSPDAKFAKQLDMTPTKAMSLGPDGYDAFENSNNKKKRKIPTSGGMGNQNTSTDALSIGMSSSASSGVLEDVGSPYYAAYSLSPSGTGMSGPGRGRYGRPAGRSVSARVPLQTSFGGKASGRRDTTASLPVELMDSSHSDQGIISAAIANAAALSSSVPEGRDNVSLLDQTRKPSPTKTQFTFTCESDSSKGMAWQSQRPFSMTPIHQSAGRPALSASPAQRSRGFSTQGTQTSPHITPQINNSAAPPDVATQAPAPPPRKPRRSPASLYALAARQRRIQQQYTNLHHPPSLEDIWICEFCEYESIFGHPPVALIRQYEIKDRKERRRLAEKRRLLEKAKMKGRRGKKASKRSSKQAAHEPSHDPHVDQPAPVNTGVDDDYGGDEYEDDAALQQGAPYNPPPAPSVTAPPARAPPPASGKGMASIPGRPG